MDKLFENWRRFTEEANGEESFTFSQEELRALNKSMARIIGTAKKVLGADGATPLLSPKSLEKVPLEPSSEPALRQVAEEDEDEVEKLRQNYYGDEGELAKSGPRSVKGLEKGLGQMDAEEFEESGFVMKIPAEVLADFEELVESSKRLGQTYEEARDWYHNIRQLLDDETHNDRDATLLGLMIATYSPRAQFSLNLAEAVFMFKAVQKDAVDDPEGLKRYLETFLGADKREPGEQRGFTNANKVPNFALNLIAPELAGSRDKETGEMKYNDLYMWNSTIDTWMIDAFYPLLKKASTSKEWEAIKGKLMSNVVSYRYMAQVVAKEAKKLNLLPHELQAIIWVSMQIRQTGDASLGVTTQFAFNQIKEAIQNVKSIENDLEVVKAELEEKSWLKTLFDEIEQKGFEQAAKFVLGLKDEKGKIQTPGVRSIASKMKRGDSFKYYPEPEAAPGEPKAKGKKKPKGPAAPKPEKSFAQEEGKHLKTYYVMNSVVQMPTGKFNNLYDSIMLYLDPSFSKEKAVEYILGRFDPASTSTKGYFTEGLKIRVGKKIR
jgi:hypothetical protein